MNYPRDFGVHGVKPAEAPSGITCKRMTKGIPKEKRWRCVKSWRCRKPRYEEGKEAV
jgi:hypothetical protein